MDKIPFSVYDFFAYLSSGAVVVATTDYVLGLNLLAKKDISPILGVVLIVLAYVTGHIIAHFSSFLLEQTIVHRILKSPSSLLSGDEPRWRLFKWLFPQYHRKLPKETQRRVKEQAATRGCSAEGEGLFLHAYAIITRNERIQERLDDFRNQYGFHRNVSFAFISSAVAIAIAHWYGSPVRLRWALLAALGGVTLFYRYLKFFRQYSYELFLRYAELPYSDAKSERGVHNAKVQLRHFNFVVNLAHPCQSLRGGCWAEKIGLHCNISPRQQFEAAELILWTANGKS